MVEASKIFQKVVQNYAKILRNSSKIDQHHPIISQKSSKNWSRGFWKSSKKLSKILQNSSKIDSNHQNWKNLQEVAKSRQKNRSKIVQIFAKNCLKIIAKMLTKIARKIDKKRQKLPTKNPQNIAKNFLKCRVKIGWETAKKRLIFNRKIYQNSMQKLSKMVIKNQPKIITQIFTKIVQKTAKNLPKIGNNDLDFDIHRFFQCKTDQKSSKNSCKMTRKILEIFTKKSSKSRPKLVLNHQKIG